MHAERGCLVWYWFGSTSLKEFRVGFRFPFHFPTQVLFCASIRKERETTQT
jgi:hypothetical protein